MNKAITIAIDGYAACGKSTLARQLAQQLGYIYLDSGAMYRAATLYFLQHPTNLSQPDAVQAALDKMHISFEPNAHTQQADTYLNGQNVEELIRSKAVSEQVSQVSAIAAIRRALVAQQQQLGSRKGIVMDGRDIGTVVFPHAELKLFMTASIQVRTQRRFAELQAKGIAMSLDEISHNLQQRDQLDSTRTESPLQQATDAVVIDNSCLSPTEQLAIVLCLANMRAGA